MSEDIKDETARLFLVVNEGLTKAWTAQKANRISEVARELAATNSDLASLIRITKLKLKEIEQEINA